MKLPDPIAPYASLLRWCLIVGCLLALLGTGFYGGYKWQADEVADARNATTRALRLRDEWQVRADQFETANGKWAARFAADEKAAADRAAKAGRILADLEAQREKSEREAAAWAQRYADAQKRPDCAALMKDSTCPIFADY